MTDKKNIISVDQLQVGLYVHLDMGWANHPFTFSSFMIKDNQQIQKVISLGIKSIRWDPGKSDAYPLAIKFDPAEKESPDNDEEEFDAALQHKQLRLKKLTEYRKKIEAVEESFLQASHNVREIMKKMAQKPEESVEQASKQIHEIIQSMLNAPELALQVISGKKGSSDIYSHALNVSIMTLIFANEMKFSGNRLFLSGLGAMLHDIGLTKVPSKVVNKQGQLTKVEKKARQHHCLYGLEMAKQLQLNDDILAIILQHHEYFNGTGYPNGLSGDEIHELAQLVGLVNHFDNLCNPQNMLTTMTPHEALSYMYTKQRDLFNPDLLQGFIRFMGVYPPGSVVRLSNDYMGLVVKAYSSMPLRPTIILYDEDIPKNEAIILDLRDESDVNISKAINPSNLPVDIYDYLNPQERTNYYFDTV